MATVAGPTSQSRSLVPNGSAPLVCQSWRWFGGVQCGLKLFTICALALLPMWEVQAKVSCLLCHALASQDEPQSNLQMLLVVRGLEVPMRGQAEN